MSRSGTDFVWRLLTALVVDILNPLFVIALALYVSVGYLLSLLMPMRVEHWLMLLIFAVCASLVAMLANAFPVSGKGSQRRDRVTWRVLAPMLPLFIFVPVFQAEFAKPVLQILNHGDLHVGYVHELLHRSTPVHNIYVPGYPANYYWLYHAILAALVKLTSLAPPLVASLLTLLAILSSLLWLGKSLSLLKLAKPRTVSLGALVILVYCALNIAGVFNLLGPLAEGAEIPNTLRHMNFAGADRRLHSVLGKVMNFTTMSLAIMCFSATLYACLRIVHGHIQRSSLVLISASAILAIALQPIVALYIAGTLLGGLALTGFIAWSKEPRKSAQIILALARVKDIRFQV